MAKWQRQIAFVALFPTPDEPLVAKIAPMLSLRRCGARGGAKGISNMRMRIAALALSGLGLLTSNSAVSAASAAYCALYAREYAAAEVSPSIAGDAAAALQRVQDQAYYHCLNQDEAPAFPKTSAYFGADVDGVLGGGGGTGGPFAAFDQGNKVSAPAATPVVKSHATRVASTVGRIPHSSGLKPQSAEWVTWCKAHYRSFDEATGLVLTFAGDKLMCP